MSTEEGIEPLTLGDYMKLNDAHSEIINAFNILIELIGTLPQKDVSAWYIGKEEFEISIKHIEKILFGEVQ